MDFIFVTGKLGQGKTLSAVARIQSRLRAGCRVATNCDIFPRYMFNDNARDLEIVRIPDRPSIHDLNMIGRGRPRSAGYDESKNGLLVLDECGDWFNTRDWSAAGRAEVNTWFRHARKLGWDVYIIVQDLEIVDKQARLSLAASIAYCKRMDKMAIPFATMFFKMFGLNIRFGKLHIARVQDADGILQDRWALRGSALYRAYDTQQIFTSDYPHGVHCLLSPWHLYGRRRGPFTWSKFMRLSKIYWRSLSRPVSFVLGFFVAVIFYFFISYKSAVSSAVVNDVSSVDLASEVAGLRIVSFRHYPDSVPVYSVVDSEGAGFDVLSFSRRGFQLINNGPCSLFVVVGLKREEIICRPSV